MSKGGAQGEQRQALRKFIKSMAEGADQLRAMELPHGGGKLTRRDLTERVLLQHFTPASVLVNKAGEILYVHGRTGKYLEMASGNIGVNVLKMARDGLCRDLTTALHTAVSHKETVCRPGIRGKTNGNFSIVNLTVYPVVPGCEETSTWVPPNSSVSKGAGPHGMGEHRGRHEAHTDLLRANNEMNNLLAGTGVGTVFVDQQMLIQRFTPAACQLINLIPTDVGRPVGHTVTNLVNYNSLEDDVKLVLDSLVPKEIEVKSKSGAWFLMSIRPYRTLENVAEGAVINFVEITKMVEAQESLRRLGVVVNDSHDAITLQDLAGRIMAWNPAAQKMYGWTEPEALAMNIRELIPEDLRKEAMGKVKQLIQSEVLQPYQTQRLTKNGQSLSVCITATALLDKDGQVYAIATTERSQGLKI